MEYLQRSPFPAHELSTYAQLKRTKPPDQHARAFDPATAPPLPPIANTDRILQVFTHPSLRLKLAGPSPDQYPDNERLSKLGKVVLDSVISEILFNSKPPLRATEILERKDEILSDESFEEWVTHHKMLAKVRYYPVLRKSSGITKPQETRDIFYAYVAGVYIDSGVQVVHRWIEQLLGQNLSAASDGGVSPQASSPMIVDDRSPGPQDSVTPPSKKVKAESMSPDPQPIFFASQPPAPAATPPRALVPQAAAGAGGGMNSPRTNPLAPARPGVPFLPLFNQTATQRRVSVTYDAHFSGPSHAGTWIVRCIVNGIPKGEGSGSSKQNAKEEAARQAYYAMGWT